MRINLNYDWQFVEDFKPEYLKGNIKKSKKINIPHTVKELPYNYFDEKDYQFVSTYSKSFRIPLDYQNNDVFITFDGVMSSCVVYLNGAKVGEHSGGYTSFKYDITPYIQFGKENDLVVVVNSEEETDVPPFGNVIDYLTYGGIYREVYLDIKYHNRFEYVLVSPVDNKSLEVQYAFNEDVVDYSLHYSIYDKEMNLVKEDKVTNCNEVNKTININIDNPHLWNIDDPYLYTLETELIIENQVYDINTTRFGVRKVEFKKDGFYLNDKRIQLIGLNRHQSYPYVGYAMPKSQQCYDAYLLKDYLHCNIVRSSHYPQSKHFYNCCDEIGLLCFIEIPGWQHLGDAKWKDNLLCATKDMVIQNFNHPSIVIWGTRVDESSDDNELYTKTNDIVKQYDKYRPTGGVRNFAHSELIEDVYTYNDFIHNGTNMGVANPKTITKRKYPYLITEHNGHMYPTKKFDTNLKRVNHANRHARVINDAMSYPQISGTIGWCFADYNTHKQFGSGDRICYHGVLDMYRLPKYAASVYRSQNDDEIVMDILSNGAIGDEDKMVFNPITIYSNVDEISLLHGKNEIARAKPDTDNYSNLPHPPFVFNDLVGDELAKGEKMSDVDANAIKQIMIQVAKEGFDSLKLSQKTSMLSLLKKYKMSIDSASKIYTKYFSNFTLDEDKDNYTFVGYKDGKEVIRKSIGAAHSYSYRISVSQNCLIEEDTYDVMKIDIYKVDQFGNVLDYANDVISLDVNGAIEIIGPTQASLIGGSISFYIKSYGLKGSAHVLIYANGVKINGFDTSVIRKEDKQ